VSVIITDQELQYFVYTLKSSSEYDFSDYSDKSLKRRLVKVMADNQCDLKILVNRIKSDKKFVEKVVKEITVNTTELFRDPPVWQNLRHKILPLFQNNQKINIWHAGCSSGQEVYSMLILLNEMGLLEKSKIMATDLNNDVLDISKSGSYKFRFNIGYLDNFDKVIRENPFNYEEYNNVPYEKYFTIDKVKDVISMKHFLRDKVMFRKHDLVKDGMLNYVKFDLIMCRNVVIYFNYDLQNRIFEMFHENLFTGGCLVLGLHETIMGPVASKFEKRGQVYFKK
jgi:chemotaxis protein methyltransferase CheR